MLNWVAGFLFSTDGKRVLLIQKNKPDWAVGKWNAVGGKIEHGETNLEAMNREFEEETGLESDNDNIDWVHFVNLYGEFKNEDGSSTPWSVSFFKAFSNLIESAMQMEIEPIAAFLVNNLPIQRFSNIKVLIDIALDNSFELPIILQDKVKVIDNATK